MSDINDITLSYLNDDDKILVQHISLLDTLQTISLAKKGTLDWSPKENWVDKSGGLPRYIERIALALIRERGMSRERAIATAINRVKKWAAGGGDVNADTRAKAVKALAEWEALKARNKARMAAKKARK